MTVVACFSEPRDRLSGQKAAHRDDETAGVVIGFAQAANQRVVAATADARIEKST